MNKNFINPNKHEYQEVSVVVYSGLYPAYSYLVPTDLQVKIGALVSVPIKNRTVYGIVVGMSKSTLSLSQLKFITANHEDLFCLPPKMLSFVQWCAAYNLAPIGNILRMVLPNVELLFNNNIKKFYSLNSQTIISDDNKLINNTLKITPKIQEICKILQQSSQFSHMAMRDLLKGNLQALKKLITNGVVIEHNIEQQDTPLQKNIAFKGAEFNANQQQVVAELTNMINQKEFKVALLDGVPGSGKTEVYFHLINEVLKSKQQVLILLPEIALSTQWLQRFTQRFGVVPYVWHSSVSPKQKKMVYQHLLNNEVKVMVGTRSSLFLPFKDLGLIVVDEEHDTSFKQEDKVIYNARDMAIARAKYFNFPIILATATPSLETWHNVQNQKYQYFELEHRYGNATMPKVELIDMRQEKPAKGSFLSSQLIAEVKHNLANQLQSLLFINRRGYAPVNLCTACGVKVICPNCSTQEGSEISSEISLVEHKSKNLLICHYCGFSKAISHDCEVCGKKDSIISFGPGVEKIAEEAKSLFPEANIALISSDVINSSTKAQDLINKIMNREVDILVGTQLIAKGYHFPKLNLVGIVDDNLSAQAVDLKSNERTWQLLYQVMGRAGREQNTGKVILQTYSPHTILIQSLIKFNRNQFLNTELNDREKHHLLPFIKLAAVILSSKNEAKLLQTVNLLKRHIPHEYQAAVKGPVPAAIYKHNNNYRYRFLVQAPTITFRQQILKHWLQNFNYHSAITLKIDIDPVSFF